MRISIRPLLKGEKSNPKTGMSVSCAGCGATPAVKPLFKAAAPSIAEFVTCRSCFDDDISRKKAVWKGQ